MGRLKCKKQLPTSKPQKTRGDSFQKFLVKNILALLGLIIMALTLFFQIYFSLAQAKPQIQPKPHLEIEQPSRPNPVQLASSQYPHLRTV